MPGTIVMKFGGTSVESAEAMERVASIVLARRDRNPVVVVSAMGKTTNKLLAMAATAVTGDRQTALAECEALRSFHLAESPGKKDLVAEIEIHFHVLEELLKSLSVLQEMTPRTVDVISSYGERLSSLIFAEQLRAHGVHVTHIDSRDVIVTDDRHTQAIPNLEVTYERLQTYVVPATREGLVVMGGFIASTEKGVTSTLGRGGSDFSAAIIGAGIEADEIQIWTDVDGMLTADPTVMKGGHRVKACSFSEAAEMAYFGAKVLHPATVLPAIDRNIPVRILNSRRPEIEGTLITTTAPTSKNVVKSIACKKEVTVLDVTSSRMLMAYGFLSRIFEIFNRLETPVDMLATSEVSVSLTIDNTNRLEEIRAELHGFAEVEVRPHRAIVCIVGEGIKVTPGVAARAFGALSDVNIHMISQGASLLNLGMVVSMADLPRAVRQLHDEFFAEVDTEVFEPSIV